MLRIFKELDKQVDTYEQVGFILKTLLTYELRDLPARYEFWYRLAVRQEHYRALQAEHRANISMYSAVGRFHQVQYEQTKQRCTTFDRLAEVYKVCCIEEERDNLNHRLSFYKTDVTTLYEHISNKELYNYCEHVQQQFWNAVSEDILIIIAHLD